MHAESLGNTHGAVCLKDQHWEQAAEGLIL